MKSRKARLRAARPPQVRHGQFPQSPKSRRLDLAQRLWYHDPEKCFWARARGRREGSVGETRNSERLRETHHGCIDYH